MKKKSLRVHIYLPLCKESPLFLEAGFLSGRPHPGRLFFVATPPFAIAFAFSMFVDPPLSLSVADENEVVVCFGATKERESLGQLLVRQPG